MRFMVNIQYEEIYKNKINAIKKLSINNSYKNFNSKYILSIKLRYIYI